MSGSKTREVAFGVPSDQITSTAVINHGCYRCGFLSHLLPGLNIGFQSSRNTLLEVPVGLKGQVLAALMRWQLQKGPDPADFSTFTCPDQRDSVTQPLRVV